MRRWLVPFACVSLTSCGGAVDQNATAERSEDTKSSQSLSESLQLDSSFTIARDIYFSGEYDSATVLFETLANSARDRRVVRVEAQALTWLGLAAWRLGDYPSARSLGEEALTLKLDNNLKDQLARSYNALGLLAWNENRLTDAAVLYERAITSAHESGDIRAEGTAGGNLGLVHTELGDFRAARESFAGMRDVMRELGEARLEGNALTNLGMLEIRIGNPGAALEPLAAARELYRSIEYVTGEQAALGQLGTAYARLGEPGLAFAVLDSALQTARDQGLRQDEASDLEVLAALCRELGDHTRALALYAEAKSINAELGLDVETAADLRDEAEIHLSLGDAELAESLTREALDVHRAVGVPLEEMRDLLMLAEITSERADGAVSRDALSAARMIADRLDTRTARAELALTEARIADRGELPRRVLGIIGGARDDLLNGRYSNEWQAYLYEARAFSQLGEFDSAEIAGRRALTAVERVRAGLGSGVLQASYAADKIEVYSTLISTLLAAQRHEEAFRVADAARVHSVLTAGSGSTHDRRPAAAGLLAGGERVLREIDRLAESIDMIERMPPEERDVAQADEIDRLDRRLRAARQEYESLLIRVAESDRRGSAILGHRLVDVAELQSVLDANQLLVEFFVTPDDTLLAFAVTPQKVHIFQRRVEHRNLVSRVRLVRAMVGRPDADIEEVRRLTGQLREVLLSAIDDAALLEGIETIIFVPHDVLNYVPYGALWDSASGSYLIENFAIRVLPSAAALPVLNSSENIVRGSPMATAAAFAPLPTELPASGPEAQEVAKAMRGTAVYVGDDATEPVLRRALEERDLVHIATHGVLNVVSPMFSRLEVSRGSLEMPGDDGRLEVHEVIALNVNASTVFLSGCETGVGRAWATDFARGEDYATLSRAFLYAGARNVIATLWPVEDAGAAVFAQQFYDRLPFDSPGTSLAKAQRAMLRDPEYASPYHWAGYQIAGDGLDRATRE